MKMDPKLVASKQKSEISYIAKRWKLPVKYIRDLVKELNTRSRARIYAVLRERGHIDPKKK